MKNIPFHQFQRYKLAQVIIESQREKNKHTILEVGANTHKNLGEFLSNDTITYLDKNLDSSVIGDNSFVLGDVCNLEYEENSFDFIIALDVLEHIDPKNRIEAVKNINRVAKNGFLLSFPVENISNIYLDKKLNATYKMLYAEELEWASEHEEYGLINIEEMLECIKNKIGIKLEYIYHGHSSITEKLLNTELLNREFQDMHEYWMLVNQYYNEEIFWKDLVLDENQAIRSIFFYNKDETILKRSRKVILEKIEDKIDVFNCFNDTLDDFVSKLNLKRLNKVYSEVRGTKELFIQQIDKKNCFEKIILDENNNLKNENNNLKNENNNLKNENNNLESEIDILKSKNRSLFEKIQKIESKIEKNKILKIFMRDI